MISAVNTAMNSINKHLESFNKAAKELSHFDSKNDNARTMVQMKRDQHQISVDAMVLKKSDELTGTLLDILA